MGLQNLYYYSWYPEVSTTANAEVLSISSAASVSRALSNWTEKLPGKKVLGWILLVFLIILITVIGYVALAPSNVSQPQPLELPSTDDIQIQTNLTFQANDTENELMGEAVRILDNPTTSAVATTTDEPSCPQDHFKSQSTGKCVPSSSYCAEEVASFHCSLPGVNVSSYCIPLRRVCDSVVDCPETLRDEERCITLSKTSNLQNSGLGLDEKTSEGFVLVRIKGIWHPYCSIDWSTKLFRSICQHLGFGVVVNADLLDLPQYHSNSESEAATIDDRPHLIIVQNELEELGSNSKLIRANGTKGLEEAEWYSCKVAYLKCRV